MTLCVRGSTEMLTTHRTAVCRTMHAVLFPKVVSKGTCSAAPVLREGRTSAGVDHASRCSSSSTPEMAKSQSLSGRMNRRRWAAAACAAAADTRIPPVTLCSSRGNAQPQNHLGAVNSQRTADVRLQSESAAARLSETLQYLLRRQRQAGRAGRPAPRRQRPAAAPLARACTPLCRGTRMTWRTPQSPAHALARACHT